MESEVSELQRRRNERIEINEPNRASSCSRVSGGNCTLAEYVCRRFSFGDACERFSRNMTHQIAR